ncbi:family 13 glycoside hydrolase [Lipomyces kononenkoae]|uniref:Family 13 glycoside hydrolase n=1 Tax=Lipomyces kononenkoae TaxID=34357 RepID=A0ACC3SWY3_LIPKO
MAFLSQTATPPQSIRRAWWKESSVYQIYPASFKDSNGDDWGDIPGIISKLDYIHSLGVDIVWLYIDPLYGTMADHDALIKGGMKYVLDLVAITQPTNTHGSRKVARAKTIHIVTGTSGALLDTMKTVIDSLQIIGSRDSQAPLGNGMSALKYTTSTYLPKGQPDLNWENSKVVGAVHNMIRFWLAREVNGVRFDVINCISKAPGTLFVYQGQEWAQANMPRDWSLEKYKDIEVLNHWKTVLHDHPNDKELQERIKQHYWLTGRDNGRTPVQWNGRDKYAGFTNENLREMPWMDIHPDHTAWNVESAANDNNSAFHYWRDVLVLRKKEKTCSSTVILDLDHEEVIAYVRTADNGRKALIVTNLSAKKSDHILEGLRNYSDANEIKFEDGLHWVLLRPYEIIVTLA